MARLEPGVGSPGQESGHLPTGGEEEMKEEVGMEGTAQVRTSPGSKASSLARVVDFPDLPQGRRAACLNSRCHCP